jgi:hypothetical protein
MTDRLTEARKAVAALLGCLVALAGAFVPGLADTLTGDLVQAAAAVATPVVVWAIPNLMRPGVAAQAENVATLAREALELRRRKATADADTLQRAARLAGG